MISAFDGPVCMNFFIAFNPQKITVGSHLITILYDGTMLQMG
jgi:hypothetical protein